MTSSAPSPVLGEPRLPRKFGRYMLFDMIGKGGMAEIFLAQAKTSDLGGQRLCVLKQIIPAFALHSQFAEMLIHEAKLAAKLDHANIVQVFDLGRAGDDLFIAMEYVEGFDLNELLRRCTKAKVPLPFEYAMLILSDVLKALDYAHRRSDESGVPLGIVHRDVSPSNVLVSLEGQSKLCDFGIAHANQVVSSKASSSMRLGDALQGKAGYMSPEHARGEPVDARADVFAVGILIWELVAGRRMYRPDSDKGSLLEQARAGVVPPLPPRDLPEEAELQRIVGKALAAHPNDRYPSAGAMLRDLDAYVQAAKLVTNPLRAREWLAQSFGTDFVTRRRMRQRAAEALERGPAVTITPLPSPPLVLREAQAALPDVAKAKNAGASAPDEVLPPSVTATTVDISAPVSLERRRPTLRTIASLVVLAIILALFAIRAAYHRP